MTSGPDVTLRTGDGRFVVPANRWDLLAGAADPAPWPRVSVVIPYYDAPAMLGRALAGLSVQDYPSDRLEVIVADDGSPQPPALPRFLRPDGVPVRLVRQPDRGFAAAAARNLGALAATGEVLCFLDQDTVPGRRYLRELVRRPALAPDVLAVGRRRHVDLHDWDAERVVSWLSGRGTPPAGLPAPAWLDDEYVRTGDLLTVHELSHRFVISAVMACSTRLFDELGGFDESFTQYGGEDWELAFRAQNNGAVLTHVRAAVGWHDGPDWAGRGDEAERACAKAAETRALDALIPRRKAGRGDQPPDVVIDATSLVCTDDQDAVAAVRGLLGSPLNIRLYLDSRLAERCRSHLPEAGTRIAAGSPPEAVLRRCRYQVTGRRLPDPELLDDLLAPLRDDTAGRVLAQLDPGILPGPDALLVAVSTRALRRAERWQPQFGRSDLVAELFGVVTLDRLDPGRDAPARLRARADSPVRHV